MVKDAHIKDPEQGEQRSPEELNSSIKTILNQIEQLLNPHQVPYNPEVILHNVHAQRLHRQMHALNTRMKKSLQGIDQQLSVPTSPPNIPEQTTSIFQTLFSTFISSSAPVFPGEPEEPERMPVSKILGALEKKEALAKEALTGIGELQKQLEALQQEAYPEVRERNTFDNTYQKMVDEYNDLIAQFTAQQEMVAYAQVGIDIFAQIGPVLKELDIVVNKARSSWEAVSKGSLTATDYATMMHAKNNFSPLVERLAPLNAQLNEHIKKSQLDAIRMVFGQILVFKNQVEHPLLEELKEIIRDQSSSSFHCKYPEHTEIEPSFKEVNETYQKILQAIKKYQQTPGNEEEVAAVNYLGNRAKVLKALGGQSLETYTRQHNVLGYDFNNLLQDLSLSGSKLVSLAIFCKNLKQIMPIQRQAEQLISQFKENFPELPRTEDEKLFFFEGATYPLDADITPFALEYIFHRERFLHAIEKGDQSTQNYDKLYAQLRRAQEATQAYVHSYIKEVSHLEQLKIDVQQLETNIQIEIERIQKMPSPQDELQKQSNGRYIEQLSTLQTSLRKAQELFTIKTINPLASLLEEHQKNFLNAHQNYQQETTDNKNKLEINKIVSDCAKHIQTTEQIKEIYDNAKNDVITEKTRITQEYDETEPRIKLLTEIEEKFTVKIRELEQLNENLKTVQNSSANPNALEKNKMLLGDYAKQVRQEKTNMEATIQEIMADERIAKLTLNKQNRFMAFLNRYIIRPFLAFIHKNPLKPTFFVNATEMKMQEIKKRIMNDKQQQDPGDKENLSP